MLVTGRTARLFYIVSLWYIVLSSICHGWVQYIKITIIQENPLDFSLPIVWNRRDPFRVPGVAELNRGLDGLRRVNVMDHLQTELPALTYAQILHIAGGPHSPNHSKRYMTGYRYFITGIGKLSFSELIMWSLRVHSQTSL